MVSVEMNYGTGLAEKTAPKLTLNRKAKMNSKHYFLVLILSLLFTACASNLWQPSEVEEVFVTDIKPGGLKIFDYSLINTTAQASGNAKRSDNGKHSGNGKGAGKGTGKQGGGKSGGYGGMSGGNSVDDGSSMKPYFIDMLESKLKKSGYCRQGYIELNSYFSRGQLEMRGECEEGATEEDRIKFVNKEST